MSFLSSDIEGDENFGFEIFEVAEAKSLTFDVFDELVSSLQFGIRIRQFKSVFDVVLVLAEGFKGLFESGIDSVEVVLNQPKKLGG